MAITASPALAAKPEKAPLGGFTVTFPAGVLCDFSVEWAIEAGGNQLVFSERPNGDVVARSVGRARGTVTNLDSIPELSVRFRGGIRQDLVFHADGTIDAIINGTVLAGYFPTDVGGPSMWLFRGHLHDQLDATFTATAHSFSGNVTDLCAALTPPQKPSSEGGARRADGATARPPDAAVHGGGRSGMAAASRSPGECRPFVAL